MHHDLFGEAIRIRVKKLKRNLPEKCSKSTKMAITACKFSNIFRESMPSDPPEPFLFLSLLQISSAEKTTLEKNVEIMPPLF